MSGGYKTLARDCEVIMIPSGDKETLKEGAQVMVMQTLGGAFTVQTRTGLLARVSGKDADVLGLEAPDSPMNDLGSATEEGHVREDKVWDVLKSCYDPEIPANIVDLGLIYECKIDNQEGGSKVDIQMTLTAPGCGMGQVLKSDIETKLLELPGVKSALVEVVFEPPWEQSRMSEAAKLQLGMM